LERGFVWRSRHGIAEFNQWMEFCSTELLNRSYLQWCGDNRVQRPMTRVQLGVRMTEIYQPSRPDRQEIIGEVETATKTAVGLSSSGFIAEDLIVKADRQHGYMVNAIDAARAQFTKIPGMMPVRGRPGEGAAKSLIVHNVRASGWVSKSARKKSAPLRAAPLGLGAPPFQSLFSLFTQTTRTVRTVKYLGDVSPGRCPDEPGRPLGGQVPRCVQDRGPRRCRPGFEGGCGRSTVTKCPFAAIGRMAP
jgi:hypothetical protein